MLWPTHAASRSRTSDQRVDRHRDLAGSADKVDEFLEAIHENAIASLKDEPGCLRFDVHRSAEDQCRFVLYEIYRDAAAFHDEHRSTVHYRKWRNAAAEFVVTAATSTPSVFSHFPTTCRRRDDHDDTRRTSDRHGGTSRYPARP